MLLAIAQRVACVSVFARKSAERVYLYIIIDEAELKDDKEEDAQKRLLKKLWLNRSYCYLKING